MDTGHQLKGPISGGASWTVAYQAGPNGGATMVSASWVPRGGATVPAPQSEAVAPNATISMDGTAPAATDAFQFAVRVELQDGQSSGTLTVNTGAQLYSATINADTLWNFLVVP